MMSQKKLGAALSYIQIIVTIMVNLLYTPIMLRMLGQSEYGIYSLSSSVIGYLALLYAGMTSTYLRYYSQYKKKDDKSSVARLNGLFLVLFSVLGGCALIIGIVLANNLHIILGNGLTSDEYDLAQILFVIMAVNMALLMPKTVFSTVIFSHERFIFIKILDVLQAMMMPIIALPLLYMGYGSIGMSCVVLLLTAASLLASTYYCIKKLACRFVFKNIPYGLIPEMLSFSIFILLQGVMDQFNWHLGKLLLANFVDSTAIAVYTVGLQIDILIISFSTALSGVFVPKIYGLVQTGAIAELNKLWLKVGRYQFFIVYFICIGFVFWGKAFIKLWAGEGYEMAYIVAIILILPLLVHLCQVLAMEVLRAYNRHGVWTIVHFAASIVGFIFCIPLTKHYGLMGVTIGTCITMFIVVNIYDNWYYAKAGNLNVWAFFKEMKKLLPAMLLTAVVAGILVSVMAIESWLMLVITGGIFTILYSCIMYKLGMNNDERVLIKNALIKLSQKIK
ncbi:MAG: oligosaccharide flippase family protein [Selenomonadales bacterium]|nr:oligosaccharide flippase family protein [Selenomonadales bacterium]